MHPNRPNTSTNQLRQIRKTHNSSSDKYATPYLNVIAGKYENTHPFRGAGTYAPNSPMRGDMHAIRTTYRGITYRSRLEARWAAFFDALGWHHTYEPFDGNGYIPDFLLRTPDGEILIEVKPATAGPDYAEPRQKITSALPDEKRPVVVVGVDPLPRLPLAHPAVPTFFGFDVNNTMPAFWCAHGSSAAGLRIALEPLDAAADYRQPTWVPDAVRAAWATACNATQWRPNRAGATA